MCVCVCEWPCAWPDWCCGVLEQQLDPASLPMWPTCRAPSTTAEKWSQTAKDHSDRPSLGMLCFAGSTRKETGTRWIRWEEGKKNWQKMKTASLKINLNGEFGLIAGRHLLLDGYLASWVAWVSVPAARCSQTPTSSLYFWTRCLIPLFGGLVSSSNQIRGDRGDKVASQENHVFPAVPWRTCQLF